MPGLLQRIQARRQKRKARHGGRLDDNYVPDAHKLRAEVQQRRLTDTSPPLGGGT